MLRSNLYIDRYNWNVNIYYAVTTYWTNEIMNNLYDINCPDRLLNEAYGKLKKGKINFGLTYSNYELMETVMVISRTTGPSEFINSLCHEKRHLEDHIWQALDIKPEGEEIAYLSGYIGQKLAKDIHYFICNCNCHKKQNK